MIQLLLALMLIQSVLAAPKYLEIWIVSNSKVSELHRLIKEPLYILRPKTAELQCQEMGDYCFDPQYGLYKKDDVMEDTAGTEVEKEQGPKIEAAKSFDRDLINCDSRNHFDVFCGKAKKEKPRNIKLDLWIDTSSSMREFDYEDKAGGCYRKSLVQRLDKTCGFNTEVNVMMFDTSIKQTGSMDSLCINQGLNDYKRVMEWIQGSDAKKLVLITDIYELNKDFADFVEKMNGVIKGDKGPLTPSQMLDLVDHLAGLCR